MYWQPISFCFRVIRQHICTEGPAILRREMMAPVFSSGSRCGKRNGADVAGTISVVSVPFLQVKIDCPVPMPGRGSPVLNSDSHRTPRQRYSRDAMMWSSIGSVRVVLAPPAFCVNLSILKIFQKMKSIYVAHLFAVRTAVFFKIFCITCHSLSSRRSISGSSQETEGDRRDRDEQQDNDCSIHHEDS